MMARSELYILPLLLLLHVNVLVLGRGAMSKDEAANAEEYWPSPRSPSLANSSYVLHVPVNLLQDPYAEKKGPYMDYYFQYDQYALPPGANRTVFQGDDLVCVNYDGFDGTSYIGVYQCPMPHEPPQYTACCGVAYAEFCCLPQKYIDEVNHQQTVGGIVFGAIILVVLITWAVIWNFVGLTKAELLAFFSLAQHPNSDKQELV